MTSDGAIDVAEVLGDVVRLSRNGYALIRRSSKMSEWRVSVKFKNDEHVSTSGVSLGHALSRAAQWLRAAEASVHAPRAWKATP